MTTTLQASPKAARIAHRINAMNARKEAEIAEAIEACRKEMEERERATPTTERLAKGDVKRVVVKGEGVRFRPRQDVVQRYEGKWRPESEVAFLRLVEDAKAADVTGVTIDLQRSGGRAAGDRMGGLGAAHVAKIEAFERFHFVMDNLPGRSRRLCEWLVLGEKIEQTGQAPTLEDVGRYLFGAAITDRRSCEMLGLGAMVIAGDILVSLYQRHAMEQRFKTLRAPQMREIGP
jgi:predicted DNA-binding protein